ncbi:MAG TPA: L-2-hydroxyglutarate oxidase, partial [Tepidisphaeraceae bacterium]|nr:L-2-hydroxyglutarate oxidase [Tepidisphaeraceae bacterium]
MATAMALVERNDISLIVLEAEPILAAHQTGHNSGVIHSGLYYKPGSLKAKLCAEGRDLMYQFCQQHNIAHEACGKVVVALDESELPALDELQRRGTANGLADLRRLSIEEIREHEPNVNGIAGMFVRETGIADYKHVTRAYGDVIQQSGGDVRTSARVKNVSRHGNELVLETTQGPIRCKTLVNCGGLQSDRVARMCGLEPEVKIVPFRGEYYKLSPQASSLVKNLIYPVPNPQFPFLGVHFTRMTSGGVEAGPNAVLALSRHGYSWSRFSPRDTAETLTYPGFWKMVKQHWHYGFGEMHRSLSKRAFLKALRRLMPSLNDNDLVPGGSGVRAQAMERNGKLVDDFRIQQQEGMVHVLNAPSPGATASIAIGRHIAQIVADHAGLTDKNHPELLQNRN